MIDVIVQCSLSWEKARLDRSDMVKPSESHTLDKNDRGDPSLHVHVIHTLVAKINTYTVDYVKH